MIAQNIYSFEPHTNTTALYLSVCQRFASTASRPPVTFRPDISIHDRLRFVLFSQKYFPNDVVVNAAGSLSVAAASNLSWNFMHDLSPSDSFDTLNIIHRPTRKLNNKWSHPKVHDERRLGGPRDSSNATRKRKQHKLNSTVKKKKAMR